jgi:hypothetical protein
MSWTRSWMPVHEFDIHTCGWDCTRDGWHAPPGSWEACRTKPTLYSLTINWAKKPHRYQSRENPHAIQHLLTSFFLKAKNKGRRFIATTQRRPSLCDTFTSISFGSHASCQKGRISGMRVHWSSARRSPWSLWKTSTRQSLPQTLHRRIRLDISV